MIFNNLAPQDFHVSYAPVFYQHKGYCDNLFMYSLIIFFCADIKILLKSKQNILQSNWINMQKFLEFMAKFYKKGAVLIKKTLKFQNGMSFHKQLIINTTFQEI